MTVGDERFRRAFAAVDAANADDPNQVVVRGQRRPKELAHAELVTDWVQRLQPDADEALLLAARAHHLRRWAVPRDSYPEGRKGYLRWRRDLEARHAVEAGEILVAAGYDDVMVKRVGDILCKRNLAGDPDVQTFEDALCLVFVETQFSDLAARTEPDHMVEITRKTLKKMSDPAKGLAVELAAALPASDRQLLDRALAPE